MTCGCAARVECAIPLIFVYRVHIERKHPSCSRHCAEQNSFAGLEGIESAREDSESNLP
jgi:hypothetical protein